METVQIRLTNAQVKGLDKLVKGGIYASRGEAVRDAVRRLEIMASLLELQNLAKKKGITKNELLRELTKVGDEVYGQKFPSA
ncbi:MAG: ribbon-helix-helix domain-containing protein [Candidatus Altiarchaeota archaeon]